MADLACIDTNVLVSALWSLDSNPGAVVALILSRELSACHCADIIAEYSEVLRRKKFKFSTDDVNALLRAIVLDGVSVVPPHVDLGFADESDRPFFEVASYCRCPLVTGNTRHFPQEDFVMTPAAFLEAFAERR
jgi:putative PIN family toxin of toxin-antitoxin system